MRLLADENLHTGIIQGLRKANFEVIFVPDIGLAGHKDREIVEYAEKNDFLVISGDKDFGGLIEFGMLWGMEEAWIMEAEWRFKAWRRGERKGVSARRAIRQIRKDLGW